MWASTQDIRVYTDIFYSVVYECGCVVDTGRDNKEQKPTQTQPMQRRKSDTTVKSKTGLLIMPCLGFKIHVYCHIHVFCFVDVRAIKSDE